jgi:DNA helicase-2/ATP-dependent DNA helicase PcrA
VTTPDDLLDVAADEIIFECLNLDQPKSFFLYAGAGSGKTRSLVSAIRAVCNTQGRQLSLSGRKIGVITYTNAACDEIKQRLEFDPRVDVSTIHAFAWSLISGFNADIRRWVAAKLAQELVDTEEAHRKGRANTKAWMERIRSMESKRKRIERLDSILRFVYSPTGDNRTRDSLNHSEVIAITAEFLTSKPALRRMLVSRCPILLIDESQDTNRGLMDAFLDLENEFHDRFCLGLFGDMMQRIYSDGKDRLDKAIPERWARPRKQMNHRCPTRVIEVINSIRHDVDREVQVPRVDAEMGLVHVFVLPQITDSASAMEAVVRDRMAEITGDKEWQSHGAVKTLALEHLMSARRFGFVEFFEPLWAVEGLRTNLLQGTGAGIGFFVREVLPLIRALRTGDKFGAMAIVRQTSPLLDLKTLEGAGANQMAQLVNAKKACAGLLALTSQAGVSAIEVLSYIGKAGLFAIPDSLSAFVATDDSEHAVLPETQQTQEPEIEGDDDAADAGTELGAWRKALEAPLEQIERFDLYVRGESQFDTHQGVKGLEFPRVLVVVNDEEARGFMFAYDKLFGTKEKSKTDQENEATGRETSLDRTRRLFYVTCSRAEKSLAIVYYAPDTDLARDAILETGWFQPDEIELLT